MDLKAAIEEIVVEERIYRMRDAGMSVNEIAGRTGRTHSDIAEILWRTWRIFHHQDLPVRRQREGREQD